MKLVITSALLFVAFTVLATSVSAQGGWRQWTLFMRDGTQLEGNPLGVNASGQFTRGVGAKEGIDRSKVSYMSVSRRELPPLPQGDVEQDMVGLIDGTRTLGPVKFRDFVFSEGTVLQNGKEIKTENIAYIKFAKPKKKTKAGT
jgi:hypothetical protein